ncbi:sulfatase-like hydrolase/transferase [Candidatus Pelagisphaera phototrophica]|uniref:sulfatase-like hydrolase/transferase n=1 Tax=Candidatus Pelagisphaera phototrophica TaxID=2684113 RepID=UPI0019E6B316|nr:sulfatase-like hydrolase/transferase [Candidatus Pelagisphaera phototrophica]QXD31408.1 sulfatase-like hydrolase/transferase [Candidatus Pelagisphaera phototrophica]
MKAILRFLCVLLLVCPGFAEDKQPNVITLLVDDLGYRDIGCYGGPVKTPVLDKLAADGIRFTDFHSGAPVCSPSRATFLTGRHHIRTGVYSVINESLHQMHLLESETTLAEVLRDTGYATAHFGKWHLGMPNNHRDTPTPNEHGFEYWFGLVNGAHPNHKDPVNFLRNGKAVGPMKGYSCQIVVDEAIAWLDPSTGSTSSPQAGSGQAHRDPNKPFFLNLWFNEPHAVIAAPDEIVSQYGALNDPAAIYNGTIDNTDRAIGRLVAHLEKRGELDNTIFHYSSDNGSYRQDRVGNLRGKKGSHFEGGHRVPGIFYWKEKIPGGRVEDTIAGAIDLLPTICGLLGIDKPEGIQLDGSDLAPLLTQSGPFERHQPLFWMNGSTMMLRMGNYTLSAPRTSQIPFDQAKANRLMQQTKNALGDGLEKELGGLDLRSRMFNGRFSNREADRLRNEFRALFYFNEAMIPLMKKGGVDRVQLYDLANDLSQEHDIAAQMPEVVSRMKKQANAIYESVMADGPEWIAAQETARTAPPKPRKKHNDLLARIDKNPLPKGYQGSSHQQYVESVMSKLKSDQRARVSELWREKRSRDPNMPNAGASYVKILAHVTGDAGNH